MIYAIGDSFTEGAELPQCGYIVDGKRAPGKGAWPELLSKMIGQEIINKGLSASGNTRIIKRVVDAVINKADGVIIGWTSAFRLELLDEAGIYDIWPGRNLWWITNDPKKKHRLELLKYLITYHTEKDNKIHTYKNFLRQVILVQNLCKNNNIKCTMFLALDPLDSDLFKYEIETYDSVKSLLNMIDIKMFVDYTLDTNSLQWVQEFPKGPNGHPLEKGHQVIADKIVDRIKELKWFESQIQE